MGLVQHLAFQVPVPGDTIVQGEGCGAVGNPFMGHFGNAVSANLSSL
jgi:hypothetical protein